MKFLLATLLFVCLVDPAFAQAAQTTVNTTAPVTTETTISIGTLAGQVFMWAATAFSGVVGTVLTAWLIRLFKLAGIQATDALRSRLQEIVVKNGVIGIVGESQAD